MIAEPITTGKGVDVIRFPSRALGLDPGKTIGWGLVEHGANRSKVMAYGVLDDQPVAHLQYLLRKHRPDVVAVETIERVHPVSRRGSSGISTVQALALYQAGRRAERLIATAQDLGFGVVEYTAERVRGALFGSERAADADIEHGLRLLLEGFPAPRKSNNHNRDGLAIALFALLDARLKAARQS